MEHRAAVTLVVVTALLSACDAQIAGYTAASTITKGGFVRSGVQTPMVHGGEIKVWGFVDHGNLYGDEGAKRILAEWWGGEGPSAASWRFNLKARPGDETGESFAVHVRNDSGRAALLDAFVADARLRRPTKVFLQGRVFSFDAPTAGATLTGLHIEVLSSQDIRLATPMLN